MNLTKRQLKQLIKEELKAVLTEQGSPLLTIKKAYNTLQGFVDHTPDDQQFTGKKFKAAMAAPLTQLQSGIAALEGK